MIYTLPPLGYSYDALEPYIDAKTMEIHYTKHHQTYIDNLNEALKKYPEVANIPLPELLKQLDRIPEDIRTAVRNNGGGHENHTQFWLWMGPKKRALDKESHVYQAIEHRFKDFKLFQELMSSEAKKRFGSGWAWLVLNKAGDLEVLSTANQDTPLSAGAQPILGLDVWEHAYYLKYQNKRVDYIAAWWHVVDWEYAESLYRTHHG